MGVRMSIVAPWPREKHHKLSVHIEGMDDHHWWCCIYDHESGLDLHLNFYVLAAPITGIEARRFASSDGKEC
jgi:hypothetical protein